MQRAAAPLARAAGRALAALLLVLVALATLASPATAREEIRSFASNVTLLANGSVDVTEVIEVTSEGNEIRRGIYRDIPTTLVNEDRSRRRSTLTVISVARDGRDEPWVTEGINNGVRIRIGDADVFLNDGVHRYTIRYTMTRMARFFPDHDELYWNATGNYWNFPILRATARVTLPDGAVISDLAAYTGYVGSSAQDATWQRLSDTEASFASTVPLDPGEGMTISASFQKGVLIEPTGMQAVYNWFSDHRDLILPGFAVLIVLLFNYFAWDAVGRDPRKGTIIPLFHAPKGFSPALVHYINRMGWKNNGWTAFTASIFDLGVKGLVHVDQVAKTLAVTVTGKAPAADLPVGQAVLFRFFSSKGKLTVDRTNGVAINTKRGEMIAAIEKESRQVYFKNNALYTLAGFGVSALLLGALVLFDVLEPIWLVVSIAIGVGIGLFTTVLRTFAGGSVVGRLILFFWGLIFVANFFGGLSVWLNSVTLNTGAIATVSIVMINVVFAFLLRAPTTLGRQIMDEIEGFKLYLDTAEKNRLNMPGEPQMTVKRFEAILPFAIALGVEKPWSQRFEGELARHAVPDAPNGTYSPGWYSGRDFSSTSGGFSNAVAAATTGMSAAMIAAQPVSSSSSGSGGGGSSGGGGGGGGGGGW